MLAIVLPEGSCGLCNYLLSDENTLDHSVVCPFAVSLHLGWAQGFRHMPSTCLFLLLLPVIQALFQKKKKKQESSLCHFLEFVWFQILP